MNSLRPIVVIAVASIAVAGCGRTDVAGHREPVQVAQAPVLNPNAGEMAGEQAAAIKRKIVYTCQIDVVVEDLTVSQQTLLKLIDSIQKDGGYLARQEVTGVSGSHRRGQWVLRVPLNSFDQLIAEIERLGELDRSSRDAQDVTEAYMDLEARLRNKQASEQRLLTHLEKSGELKDTLELERELARVRGEIEQLQGQLNLLKSRTDLATVTVTLWERPGYTPPSRPTFVSAISRTFNESLSALVNVAQGLCLVAVALLPWAVSGIVAFAPFWLLLRLMGLNGGRPRA